MNPELVKVLGVALTVILTLAGVIVWLTKKEPKKAKLPGNPFEEPGTSAICLARGEIITRHDERIERILGELKEEKVIESKFRKEVRDELRVISLVLAKINGG